MERAAQIDLALDVGDATSAHADACRDPARTAEREAAKLQHREPIDLPDLGATRVQQHDLTADRLLSAVAKTVGPLNVLVDGACHCSAINLIAGRLARPIVGLPNNVGQVADLDRQLVTVVRQPRPLLDQPRHTTSIRRPQAMLLHDRRNQLGVSPIVLR